MERYQAAKSVSIPRLTSFLYDISSNVDPTVRIRSGSMIRVQVESVKRRKTEGSSRKRNYLLLKIRKIQIYRLFLVEKQEKRVKRNII